MTPEEKAKELIEQYCKILFGDERFVNITKPKQCAIICVDEIMSTVDDATLFRNYTKKPTLDYWQQVKNSINNQS